MIFTKETDIYKWSLMRVMAEIMLALEPKYKLEY